MLNFNNNVILAAFAIFLTCGNAIAKDWSICDDDMDGLRRRADDASTAAKDADQKKRQLKSADDALAQCRQYPQIYDLMRDNCRSKAFELDMATSSYRTSLQFLRGSLDDVDSKVRSASSSCSFDFGRILGSPPTVPDGVQNREQCAMYVRYKGRIPILALIDACSKQMASDECKKCLE